MYEKKQKVANRRFGTKTPDFDQTCNLRSFMKNTNYCLTTPIAIFLVNILWS